MILDCLINIKMTCYISDYHMSHWFHMFFSIPGAAAHLWKDSFLILPLHSSAVPGMNLLSFFFFFLFIKSQNHLSLLMQRTLSFHFIHISAVPVCLIRTGIGRKLSAKSLLAWGFAGGTYEVSGFWAWGFWIFEPSVCYNPPNLCNLQALPPRFVFLDHTLLPFIVNICWLVVAWLYFFF
jgi:hypothetical protein